MARLGAVMELPLTASENLVLQEFAAQQLGRCAEMAAEVARYVHRDLGGRPGNHAFGRARLIAATEASVRSNLRLVLGLLAAGQSFEGVPVTSETRRLGRVYAEEGISLESLVAACRVGDTYWYENLWRPGIEERFQHSEGLERVLPAVAGWARQYTEQAIASMATEHALTSAGRVDDATERLLLAVREVLAGGSDRLSSGGRPCGDLDGLHCAVILRRTGRPVDLGPVADRLRGNVVVSPSSGEVWLWTAGGLPEGWSPPPGVAAGVGRQASGADGFRESHEQAREALRLGTGDGVVRYDEIELVSLLVADLDRARHFVRHELGRLADPEDDHVARLRQTLLAYLEEGDSNLRAARRLFVHPNTVRYRVAQALELLGRPAQGRRTRLAVALTVADVLTKH